MDLSRWVSFWAEWSPRRIALRFEGTGPSYAELEAHIAACAHELLWFGICDGERLAYLGPNRPELLEFLSRARGLAPSSSRSTPACRRPNCGCSSISPNHGC